ncbi:MAG: hypothetical protein LBR45_03600 [Bacteroidales bacterium]|jgi:DNA-binding CsgD family transcriptional regulator|nr:hypothetical protein [Bacteroidales bacterium]
MEEQWNISKRNLQALNEKNIKKMLNSFNLTCSGQYYMIDCSSKKIIVDSPYSVILCGHSQKLLQQKDLDFYGLILKKKELAWAEQVGVAANKIFERYPVKQRAKFVYSHDLPVRMINGEDIILHHKITPFAFCKNGNVWLKLCHVSISDSKEMICKAFLTNVETNERFVFTNDEFVLYNGANINQEEILILKLLIKSMPDKDIHGLLKISLFAFKQKKHCLFKKLEVKTSAAAIHKAHLLGII